MFFLCFFLSEGIFLTFVLYLSVYCIKYAFRIYILLHIKKHYFIHFFAKALNVSLIIRQAVTRSFTKTILRHRCFLWILRNASEQLFSRKRVKGYFWISAVDYQVIKCTSKKPWSIHILNVFIDLKYVKTWKNSTADMRHIEITQANFLAFHIRLKLDW